MKLLVDTFVLDYDRSTINEGNDPEKPIMLVGIIQKADTKNQNGRIYPYSVLQREVENYKKLISECRATGELDHPDSSVIELKNVSHIFRDIWWEGKNVMGKLEVLDSRYGKELKVFLKAGIKIGISSRGVGNTKEVNGVDVVEDDYSLIAFDCVSDPSTPGAFLKQEAKELKLEEVKRELAKVYNKSDRVYRICNKILNKCDSRSCDI